MSKCREIIIYGTGGLGRGIVDLIDSINKTSLSQWDVIGFVDDNEIHSEVNGFRVLGGSDYLLDYQKEINVVLAFGSSKVRERVYNTLSTKENIYFPNLIHPSVEVSIYNQFGKGNVISKGVALSTNITISDFNLIHYNCSIGHDVSMGDYNSVFPLVALSGYDDLGNCVEIGTNSSVIPNISMGDNAKIGAGTVVINDVRKNKTVVGVPGKEV